MRAQIGEEKLLRQNVLDFPEHGIAWPWVLKFGIGKGGEAGGCISVRLGVRRRASESSAAPRFGASEQAGLCGLLFTQLVVRDVPPKQASTRLKNVACPPDQYFPASTRSPRLEKN